MGRGGVRALHGGQPNRSSEAPLSGTCCAAVAREQPQKVVGVGRSHGWSLGGVSIDRHVATLPHKVILQLLEHPLTSSGLEKFLADAKKIPTA